MRIYEIEAKRQVPLDELTLNEVTVLPSYFIPAEEPEEALDLFWLYVPVEVEGHFEVEVRR